jgi:DNA-binding IclR family transcriptional regulator
MPLPPRQIAVLRYLHDHKTAATTRKVTRELRMSRDNARNALQGLAGKGLVTADHADFPVSWSITDTGSAVLAAATEQDP